MAQNLYKQVVEEHVNEILDAYKEDKITKQIAKVKILKCIQYATDKLKTEDNRADNSHNNDKPQTSGV